MTTLYYIMIIFIGILILAMITEVLIEYGKQVKDLYIFRIVNTLFGARVDQQKSKCFGLYKYWQLGDECDFYPTFSSAKQAIMRYCSEVGVPCEIVNIKGEILIKN